MNKDIKNISIYTDGACSGNPGPGGWAAILEYKGAEKEISGFFAETTNNRMELTAAIEGLRALKEKCRVRLYSDSSYLINAFQKNWLKSWQRSGWEKSDGKPVLNVDLWNELAELAERHSVEWIKVKGHSDDEKNERCDVLARGEIENFRKKQKNNIDN